MSVVTVWRFDVYYLLLMCHIYYVHESQDEVVSVREFVTLFFKITCILGHTMAQLVEALCYKPEGCRFDS